MTNGKRILLVDDDRDIVHGTALRLSAAGYDSVAVHDGEEVIASALENRPDAIVLDVRMSGLDGLTVLRRLREQEATRYIPVVMLSASLVDKEACLEAGARFFVTKPYAPQALLAAIRIAIEEASIASVE
jgi:DNA-binding response OmpR family regulator